MKFFSKKSLIAALLLSPLVGYLASVLAVGYSMPSAWYAEVEGAKDWRKSEGVIRYAEMGEGDQAIIFLHGFNAQINLWNGVWQNMNGCARAIRLDIPGFGGSYWDTSDYSIYEQEKRILQFVKEKKLAKVTLVGSSMGASLAAVIAAKNPELIENVILIAPSGYPGSLRYSGLFGRLIKTGALNDYATWVAGTAFYQWLFPRSIALQSLTTASSYTNQWVADLKKIDAPVAILWSRGDGTVPYDYSQLIARELKNERLVALDDSIKHSAPTKMPMQIAQLACAMAPQNIIDSQEQLASLLSNIFNPDAIQPIE